MTTRAAFVLQTSILLLLLASSAAPTPLYATYQAEWGFSPITVTVIFGVYAVAVLAALLVFGRLSDHVGRRPVLLVALVVQAATMLLFALANGVPELVVARIIQGLATGSAVAAIGAGLVDLHQTRGAIANAVGAMAGTATGALGSALLVDLMPAPTQLVYLILLAAFLVQAAGVLRMPETSARIPGARASLRPRVAVPHAARGALGVAAPALIAVWALAGFYGSLGPALAHLVAGSDSTILGGGSLFVLAAAGALSTLLLRDVSAHRLALAGNLMLATGVATTLAAVSAHSIVLFFAGTAISGVGFGGGFQGALRTVVPLAGPTGRAGLISVVYTISYLAMGLPAIIAGALVVNSNVPQTAREFGAVVIALAAAAFAGTILRKDRRVAISV
ncbi:MAG: hypothetical protein QOF76_4966 [Solirubrobacteraceae bacterium]|jgi:predicted MFS family arabinose efflux permease|nr:hypothetical protein [Solirubrobacteraceae bacterium]